MSYSQTKYELALVLNQKDYPEKEIQEVRELFKREGIKILSSEYASFDFTENLNLIILLNVPTLYFAIGFFTEFGKDVYQFLKSQIIRLINHKKNKNPFVLGFRIKYQNSTIFLNVNCPFIDAETFLKKSPKIFQIVFHSIENEIDEEIFFTFIKTNRSLTKYVAILYTLDVGPKYLYDLSTKKLHLIENANKIEEMVTKILF